MPELNQVLSGHQPALKVGGLHHITSEPGDFSVHQYYGNFQAGQLCCQTVVCTC